MSRDESHGVARRVIGIADQATRVAAQHVWIWPLLGILITTMAGLWVRVGVERAINNELAAHLQSVLSAEVNALRVWFKEKESDVKTLALDAQIQAGIAELVERNRDGKASPAELSGSPAAKELRLCLRQRLEPQGYSDFIVVDKKGKRILASFEERLIGRREPDAYGEYVHRTFRGYSTATRPFPSEVPLPDAAGIPHAEVPTMFVMAPVRNTNGVIIAALALRMQPEEEFDKLFSIGHMGESGETYAFDRDGLMLTRGRFESELKSLGLLPDQQDDSPVLRLRLLDPGVDLRKSKPSSRPNHDLGLTKMAAEATRGRSGFDTHGYRDYRGVPVMGAWTWLPDYRMGIATEVSVQEAYEPLYVLRQAFLAMFFLLVLTFIALFGFSLRVRQLQAAARKSALTARRLGQYALLQDIGAGGNGRVYKARHAMLRRPVAVKLLNPEFMDETTVARFQREVQATSQLTHPNTVAIYDYGRTPEGVFYYAMEFLGGFNLDKLVKRFGPQPEGRVICILQQVCGSLSEAHTLGLIHRDIKPANILLTRRGGICDMVKVLDFGVVKAINPAMQPHLQITASDGILGTPSYLSPEAVEAPDQIDARSDLYSVGAVGYFLLTGHLLFDLEKVRDWLEAQVHSMPAPPSERLGKTIDGDLEKVVMQCLAKDREQRPQSASDLSEALGRCKSAGTWTSKEAGQWWQTHRAEVEPEEVASAQEKTLVIARPLDGVNGLNNEA